MPKISAKFQRGHPQRVAKQRWGSSNQRFSISISISQKRCKIGTLLLWNANRNSYASIVWRYFQWPWMTHNYPKPSHFWYFVVGTNHMTGAAEARVVKFCTQVSSVKSQYTDDRSPLKGRGQSHVTHCTFSWPQWYLWNCWS